LTGIPRNEHTIITKKDNRKINKLVIIIIKIKKKERKKEKKKEEENKTKQA
jgi:hypothetical protein